MGLRTGKTDKNYYEGQEQFGGYQFVSLFDIINQFSVAYVGDKKIIRDISHVDIAFFAQRALQELSFDTLKSFKSQQIQVSPSLQMVLPHDYVNYTKLSWVDSAGIKHPLYPTSSTSNPFELLQEANGQYSFPTGSQLVANNDYAIDLQPSWTLVTPGNYGANYTGSIGIDTGKLNWKFVTKNGAGAYNWSQIPVAYQEIDVSTMSYIDISADGVAEAATYNVSSGGTNTISSTVRFGVSTSPPDEMVNNVTNSSSGYPVNPNASADIFDLSNGDGELSYLEWTGTESSTKEVIDINVSGVSTIYVIALAIADFPEYQVYGQGVFANTLDNVSVTNATASVMLQSPDNNSPDSSTWNAYKSGVASENQDDYIDDTYWPMDGSRYGLDPQQAQANGSYFIDQRLGKIHFSSNIAGKTVILDYISDSLGTDGEMQVHKFAEEAMYKHMIHAIASTSSWGQQLVPRLTKEKFAAVRKAKLRLSNIKMEEITQILRGKSKQIKH
tara:strand:- start:3643 stop:5142 length:1500 start_codon:yes stop_codon:yes gene_type:complete